MLKMPNRGLSQRLFVPCTPENFLEPGFRSRIEILTEARASCGCVLKATSRETPAATLLPNLPFLPTTITTQFRRQLPLPLKAQMETIWGAPCSLCRGRMGNFSEPRFPSHEAHRLTENAATGVPRSLGVGVPGVHQPSSHSDKKQNPITVLYDLS